MEVVVCNEPWSNVDELGMRDFSDCHINNEYIKSTYMSVICMTSVLFCISGYKMYLSVKVREFNINYIPHLCCICFWGFSVIQLTRYTYKYLAFKKLADIATVGTLLDAVATALYFPGAWLTILYLMAVSLSAEIGGRGAVVMAKLDRLAFFLGGSSCILYTSNILLLLIGDEMLRPVSYGLMVVFIYICVTIVGALVVYGRKVDALLTKVIINSSVESQQRNSDKEKARDKVKSVIKNRRTLRIGVLMLVCGCAFPCAVLALATMLYDELARNSWISVNFIFFIGGLSGIVLLGLVNTSPPNSRTSTLLFLGGLNVASSTRRRRKYTGSAFSTVEKATSQVGGAIKHQTKRLSEALTSTSDDSKTTKIRPNVVYVDSKPEGLTDAQSAAGGGGAQEEESQQSPADQAQEEATARPTDTV